MITFKSTEDLAKLPPEDPAFTTVRELVERLITAYTTPGKPYNWQDYGYVILIEEADVNGTFCNDGMDEDCDGESDCADPTGECDFDPACACLAKHDFCFADSECYSNKCRGGKCR